MKEYIAIMLTDKYPGKGNIVIAISSMIVEDMYYVVSRAGFTKMVWSTDIFIIGEL